MSILQQVANIEKEALHHLGEAQGLLAGYRESFAREQTAIAFQMYSNSLLQATTIANFMVGTLKMVDLVKTRQALLDEWTQVVALGTPKDGQFPRFPLEQQQPQVQQEQQEQQHEYSPPAETNQSPAEKEDLRNDLGL